MEINVNALTERYQQQLRERRLAQAIGEGIMTDKQIGELFGLTPSAVNSRRRTDTAYEPRNARRQMELRRNGWTPQLQQLTLQALVEGHTVKEVSRVTGITPGTINAMMRDLGITDLKQRSMEPQPVPKRSKRIGALRRYRPRATP